MFFDRPRDALAAVRRCLKPQGRLVAAVWAEPAQVGWWSLPREVLRRHAPLPVIDPTAPGPFRYASPPALQADLTHAGFTVEHEEVMKTPVMESTTPEGLIGWCLAFGLSRALAPQPVSVREAWRRDMLAEADRVRDADGCYRLGGATRLVVARLAP